MDSVNIHRLYLYTARYMSSIKYCTTVQRATLCPAKTRLKTKTLQSKSTIQRKVSPPKLADQYYYCRMSLLHSSANMAERESFVLVTASVFSIALRYKKPIHSCTEPQVRSL